MFCNLLVRFVCGLLKFEGIQEMLYRLVVLGEAIARHGKNVGAIVVKNEPSNCLPLSSLQAKFHRATAMPLQ